MHQSMNREQVFTPKLRACHVDEARLLGVGGAMPEAVLNEGNAVPIACPMGRETRGNSGES